MDIFQEIYSDKYLLMVRRRLDKDFNIRNKSILQLENIKNEFIKMSNVIYDIICRSDRYTYQETLEKITQIFIDNYAMKNNLVMPKLRTVKLQTPDDYRNMDAYNEYKTVLADRSTMTHTAREYDNLRRYALQRHVDKSPELPYATERDYGIIRKIKNYAYTDDKIPDYDWELNNDNTIDFNWSKEPKDRKNQIDYGAY